MKNDVLLRRFWSLCHTLRDEGVSSGEYLEQLTYLLFLKMLDQRDDPSLPVRSVPPEADWRRLRALRGAALVEGYARALRILGDAPGILGTIYRDARARIADPARLAKLVETIDAEDWLSDDEDVKGDLYEGLLQKSAEDVKSGAGQYFTPRPLIEAIVECVDPQPMRTIADPACGTGGFLLGAHSRLRARGLDREQEAFLRGRTFIGCEIVPSTYRLCLMNLHLHGIGLGEDGTAVRCGDALAEPVTLSDYVFANPPFGRRSSVSQEGAAVDVGEAGRRRTKPTANKQLAFVRHVAAMLAPGGKAAVIVPDNVLFERGAGDVVRRMLLLEHRLHTILRLPTGIFYAQGVKANVLFFDAAERDVADGAATWCYDLRSSMNLTLKQRSLRRDHLADFVRRYVGGADDRRIEDGRFRRFAREDLLARPGANLDLRWAHRGDRGDVVDEPSLHELGREIRGHLEAALSAFERAMH